MLTTFAILLSPYPSERSNPLFGKQNLNILYPIYKNATDSGEDL